MTQVRSVRKRGFLSPSDSLGGLGKAAEDERSVNFARSDPAPGRLGPVWQGTALCDARGAFPAQISCVRATWVAVGAWDRRPSARGKTWAVRSLSPAVVFVALACAAAEKRVEPPAPPPGATLAFRDVRVFDGEKVLGRANVLVGGGRILAVGDGAVPAGVEVIDGAGRSLLPGLIDAHAHVFDGGQLEQSLVFGVTTVLDMFTMPAAMKQLRAGDVPQRAELRSAGILATAAGGHGTQFGFSIPTLARPDEAPAFVDARVAEGSDYIKIVYDSFKAYGTRRPTLSRETVAALVAAAHARGKLAVVHVGDHDAAVEAINAGADGLVHLFRDRAPDDGFGALAASRKAFVTPTLAVTRRLYGEDSAIAADEALVAYLLPAARDNLRGRFPLRAKGAADAAPRAIAQLRDAGVPILCGTDAPNPGTTHGATMHDELALLVRAGLTPVAALTGATAAAARVFRLDDRGRLAPGLRADLLLVDGDPTADITRSRHIVGVWRGGERLDRDAVKARVAAAAAAAATVAAPDRSAAGVISDFEAGSLDNRFGQPWTQSTDAMMGGASTVKLDVVGGGAGRAGKALAITGTIVTGKTPVAWAGALFSPGKTMFEPVNLSATKGLRFKAKGDGKSYAVMVFSRRRGPTPIMQPFTPGASFAPVELPWAKFDGTDGTDVMGIFIGASGSPGAFSLAIDDVELL